MKKVIYYNVDDDVDIEGSTLKELEIDGIELINYQNGDLKFDPGTFVDVMNELSVEGAVIEYIELTKDMIDKLDTVKIISVQAIGYSNIDIKAATEKGILVTNAPGFCTEEVAVHTVGFIIDCIKNITWFDREVRRGKWDSMQAGTPKRLSGQTVGLVFFGAIPKKMLPILKALDLEIICYAPTKSAEYLENFGVEKTETLDDLLVRSDFVSMHCPLIYEEKPGRPATYHMMDKDKFKLMKPSAYFINTARGAIVDEKALVSALRNGTIRGAAVDLIEDETSEKSDLFDLDNCIITPHAAFVSEEAFTDARKIAIKQQAMYLDQGRVPDFIVNPEVIK